jgi:hypothetical protein
MPKGRIHTENGFIVLLPFENTALFRSLTAASLHPFARCLGVLGLRRLRFGPVLGHAHHAMGDRTSSAILQVVLDQEDFHSVHCISTHGSCLHSPP